MEWIACFMGSNISAINNPLFALKTLPLKKDLLKLEICLRFQTKTKVKTTK